MASFRDWKKRKDVLKKRIEMRRIYDRFRARYIAGENKEFWAHVEHVLLMDTDELDIPHRLLLPDDPDGGDED